jgi:peptide/nickel transport system substrate-binding protein
MKRSWILILLAILLTAALMLSACQPKAEEPVEDEGVAEEVVTEPQPQAEERKVATFIWTQEFDTLNPYYTNMWFSGITQQLWDCWAWDFDDQNNPLPVLVTEMPSAENGGISADGTVLTLKLKDNLVWSDGDPLDSADFLFTYNMVMDSGNTVASTYPLDLLVSVEAPDAQTVVMTFEEPFAPWVATLWHGILPEHILKPVFEAEGTIDTAAWNTAPSVGCGPYVFAEWESGSFTRFVANENYWMGTPKIDEVFFRFVPDDASQVAALQTGDGDLGTFIAYSDIPALEEAGVKIIWSFSGYNEGWYFNLDPEMTHPALLDVNVRKAIAMAFDRQSLTEDLLLGMTKPAATEWDNTPYVNPTIEPWPYDPDEANRLLDEAGWVDSNGDGVRDKDGVELVLTYGTTTREIRRDTQAVAQQQLAEVGVKLELMSWDSDIYFAGYGEGGPAATGQLDIFEYSTVVNFPDPDTAEWLCREIPNDESPDGLNWQRVCDTDLENLFLKQVSQVDFAARQQTFFEISQMIFEKVYWLGVWQDPDSFAIGPRLENVKISGVTPFYNISEWDLNP